MIIDTKVELKRIIHEDCLPYKKQPSKKFFIKKFLAHPDLYFCRFLKYMRNEQYYKRKSGIYSKIKYLYYMRKKNIMGYRLGLEINGETIGEGILIRHYGSIVINSFASLGNHCTLRGNNCIGVARDGEKATRIVNNVDIVFGAIIIGDIDIADGVTIGANAVVTKSCNEKNAVLVGSPARILKRGEKID